MSGLKNHRQAFPALSCVLPTFRIKVSYMSKGNLCSCYERLHAVSVKIPNTRRGKQPTNSTTTDFVGLVVETSARLNLETLSAHKVTVTSLFLLNILHY